MMNQTQHPFFVYGTLLPEQPNFYLWRNAVQAIMPATFEPAILYDLGSFPMLIEGTGEQVYGAVVTVEPDQYVSTMTELDALEHYYPDNPDASIYERVLRTVQLKDGTQQVAWLYVGQQQFVQGRQAFGGDWVGHSAESQTKINQWWHDYNDEGNKDLLQGSN